MTVKRRITTFVLLLAIVFTMGGELFSAFVVKANAATVTYSSVLDDLGKDSSFNPEDYPSIADDYSLKVIQIAESEDDELFVYVYQPSSKTKFMLATSISLSISEGLEYSPSRYPLTLLDADGVFAKYRVDEFKIPADYTRKYIITGIYRVYDNSTDGESGTDNTIDEICCGVGQTWTVSSVNDKINVNMESEDYVTVTSKHVGFARYTDSESFWLTRNTDSHYIAFSTDKEIDKLYEVDVNFKYKSVMEHYQKNIITGSEKTWEDIVEEGKKEITVTAEQLYEKNNTLWFPDYEYMRIQTVDALIKNEGSHMDDAAKENLQEKEWVVRFYESPYAFVNNSDGSIGFTSYRRDYTVVTEVAMLRLKYEFDGKIYNLGVVDNVQSGDNVPDWFVEPENQNWWLKIMMLLVLILLWQVASPFITPILTTIGILIWDSLKIIIGLVWYVITIPFRFVAWLFKPK